MRRHFMTALFGSLLFNAAILAAESELPRATVSHGPEMAKPALRQAVQRAAPPELIKKLLDTNRHWLRPDPQRLSYAFSMEHPGKGDRTQLLVEYAAPNRATVHREHRELYAGVVSDDYQRDNNGYPPQRSTLAQGVTLFGPLQEFAILQGEHVLNVAAEETLDGADAWVLHLRCQGKPSAEEMARWEARLRLQAMRSKYFYEFTPVQRTVDGKPRAEIELKCAGEEGPGWKELLAARQKNPAEIRWGGQRIEAAIQEYRGRVRPVIVLNNDPQAGGAAHVTAVQFLEGGVNNVTPKLGLGEGEPVFNEKLYRQLKGNSSGPTLLLPIRVGCGIFGSWYGYSGGGAEVDQIWVEKASGRVLREEGFYQGEPRFVIAYGPFEKTSDNGQVPRQVVARLFSKPSRKIYPWVFQMEFQLLGGKTWLLKELHESQGQRQNVAIAAVSGASLSAANAEKVQDQPSGAAQGPAPVLGVRVRSPVGQVVVEEVFPRSGAAKADLRPGDVILSYNGVAVTDLPKLLALVHGGKVGDTVSVEVLRKEAKLKKQITLASRDELLGRPATPAR